MRPSDDNNQNDLLCGGFSSSLEIGADNTDGCLSKLLLCLMSLFEEVSRAYGG